MKYIEGYDRNQLILVPERLDDLVSENNPVRVIDAFVNQLNLARMGFTKTMLDMTSAGRPCFSPAVMLKLYVYGYYKKIRSSRKLMEMCVLNIEVMWLLGRLAPDFRTIAEFRRENAGKIKDVFKAFVRICVELGLYNKDIVVQDGSKFRAVNSKDNNVTEPKLEKKLEITEEKIEKYLEEMDRIDQEEIDTQKYSKEEVERMLEVLKARKEEYNRLLDEMKEKGVTQFSFTDPESKLMKTANGGFDVCYNAQILVDPSSHIIGDFDVTNQCNDNGLLSSTTEQIKKDLNIDVIEVVADKGYEDRADMLNCLLNGTIPHVPSVSGAGSYEMEMEYKEAEITEELLNSTDPKAIKTCMEAGVLPNAYIDKGIEVSVIEVERQSCQEAPETSFILNEEGTAVMCPSGSVLNKVATLYNKEKTRFVSRSACASCEDKCTTAKFKQVDLKVGQTALYLKTHQTVKKVRIKLTPDRGKIANRKCVAEHPFGTVKRWQDGYYLLLKGKEKASADLAFLFLAYNLKRVINLLSVQEIVERMRAMASFYFHLSSFLLSLLHFARIPITVMPSNR